MSAPDQQLIRGSRNGRSGTRPDADMEARKAMALCGAGSFSAWPQRSFRSAQRRGLESEVWRDAIQTSDDASDAWMLNFLERCGWADGGQEISTLTRESEASLLQTIAALLHCLSVRLSFLPGPAGMTFFCLPSLVQRQPCSTSSAVQLVISRGKHRQGCRRNSEEPGPV
jgi:hypothetical protein